MKFQICLPALLFAVCAWAIPGYADDVKKVPLQGNVEKHKRDHDHGRHEPARLPSFPPSNHRVEIQQPPAKDHANPFQSMSQSMPSAAVKEDLRRKNELPSAQTAILTPGAKMNMGSSPAATMPSGTTGANAKILNPSGQAVSRPGSSTFSK